MSFYEGYTTFCCHWTWFAILPMHLTEGVVERYVHE